jgi:mannose-6-phosphate isomerase-like protein (cupin superfamily)
METNPVQTTAIDYSSPERFVSLRRALGVSAFGLNQITLQPGQRGRIHRHTQQEEVYLVLRGRLMILIEQEDELELGEGMLARVPAQVRRQLVNPFSAPCTLVAVGAAGEHAGRDGEAFTGWSETEGRPPREVPLPEDLP